MVAAAGRRREGTFLARGACRSGGTCGKEAAAAAGKGSGDRGATEAAVVKGRVYACERLFVCV